METKSMKESQIFQLKVSGENACFTRPEMKAERVSYDVITPSAARAIFDAILWKPAILWIIHKIDILKPILWESIRRNELGSKIAPQNIMQTMEAGTGNLALYIEEERQQRAGLFLKDVSYILHASFKLTKRAGDGDSITKFEEMFKRRAEKGQCHHQPYFGSREFAAYFSLNDQTEKPIKIEQQDLGWMLYDLDFEDYNFDTKSYKDANPKFFQAVIQNGSIVIPDLNTNGARL
ncbi:CRISPR-associated protein Cas5 [Leptospira interrogans serovar Manilae]|uniref:pre-crRNA processing endonuclease n=1 Tax=Leptospira interrogans serovar Manilae TaxID=214675 RepID=A0AAQ1P1L0_LEPIR|nr:type I-C CRISPR-associated protein Cas5c [Leptospira interrogans]AKP24991.1 CRISPR-associated protein [Leptospira interrogans serovar Manilae]AKP28776.1 CRISPR-associated protein [Leptospira interrogans serovar Manilae]EYU64960.1 CRISPR-associated protein [Leptospira interrogans serovar Manilae]SOR62132.1 CRISPR-associated protein Cas5 [Leptospira interrogans serovar Manilae]